MRASGKRHSGWKKEWPVEPPWGPEMTPSGWASIKTVTVPVRTRSITNWHVNRWVNSEYVRKVRKAIIIYLRATREMQKYLDQARVTLEARETFAMVRLTRFGPQVLDDDNLRAALKATRDSVAQQLAVDDGDTSRIKFDYHQVKGPFAVRIDIALRAT